MAAMAASIYFNRVIVAALGQWGSLIRTAGVMTYPLYLLHYHVGGAGMVVASDAGLSNGSSLVVGIAASAAAAYASAMLVEPKLYQTLKAWVRRTAAKLGGLSFVRRPTHGLRTN